VDVRHVEHAQQALNDLGEVALLARHGEGALAEVRIVPFRPVRMMLAQQGTIAAPSLIRLHLVCPHGISGLARINFMISACCPRIYKPGLTSIKAKPFWGSLGLSWNNL
jgi:hypothetical protein